MPTLTLHRKQWLKVGLPYWVFINGQPIGIMRGREVNIHIPKGIYIVGTKLVFPLWRWRFELSGETSITLSDKDIQLQITDRERWWNLLFDIDLCLWIASFFVELPHPWNIVYHILSEGFFALWLIRIVLIRKRYFVLTGNQ